MKIVPGKMGSCLRPVEALGVLWGPAHHRGYERPCYRCNIPIQRGMLVYHPMAGDDRGRRLHVDCVLGWEKEEASYRAKVRAMRRGR